MEQEVATGLTILGTAVGSAKLLEKLLGPTAEYIGGGVKTWTERRVNNVARILGKAADKLGASVDAPGAVPPKVLKGILDEGSFCDDELTAEYFGGVLAASRSEVPRDDRGAAYVALLGRLSAYQIRAHYLTYFMMKRLWDGETVELWDPSARGKYSPIIGLDSFESAMEFGPGERPELLINHILMGLDKEGLLSEQYATGAYLSPYTKRTAESGIRLNPTIAGVELFLWAHGRPDLPYAALFDADVSIELFDGLPLPEGYRRLTYSTPSNPKGR